MIVIVNVKLSGGDNRARILKWGITASSTNSAEVAVRNAIDELCHRTGRDAGQATFNWVTTGVCAETWTVSWKE